MKNNYLDLLIRLSAINDLNILFNEGPKGFKSSRVLNSEGEIEYKNELLGSSSLMMYRKNPARIPFIYKGFRIKIIDDSIW